MRLTEVSTLRTPRRRGLSVRRSRTAYLCSLTQRWGTGTRRIAAVSHLDGIEMLNKLLAIQNPPSISRHLALK
jgi:hypothetical protein